MTIDGNRPQATRGIFKDGRYHHYATGVEVTLSDDAFALRGFRTEPHGQQIISQWRRSSNDAEGISASGVLREEARGALARGDILDAVWGNSVIVTPRSIDRCVATLRAKIEPDPRRPQYVQTIRDVGYRFEPGPED